ncbi:uncharacterized protein LOC133646183 [Entelurus aequoreus]|uniref:uncharacterized protein LOC133646183 n=1 Tax=Entelurus aequoreus TaxID=161455 RepID=UPI002B1E1BBA|nr:uncharacterized protein LOC133646183 [Entelurus aequoreus]
MSQLDRYTPKLLELFSAKGGVTGQRIKNLLTELIQDPSASAVMKRDVTLRCLIEYTGESGQELISDYCGTAETTVHEDLEMKNMSIYICREANAVGIIIEGVPVLTHLGNLAKVCRLLLGLTYALNLEYPSKLSKTFEVFQRLFVGLDTLRPKPTPKFMTLKKKLVAYAVSHDCQLALLNSYFLVSVQNHYTLFIEWNSSECCPVQVLFKAPGHRFWCVN